MAHPRRVLRAFPPLTDVQSPSKFDLAGLLSGARCKQGQSDFLLRGSAGDTCPAPLCGGLGGTAAGLADPAKLFLIDSPEPSASPRCTGWDSQWGNSFGALSPPLCLSFYGVSWHRGLIDCWVIAVWAWVSGGVASYVPGPLHLRVITPTVDSPTLLNSLSLRAQHFVYLFLWLLRPFPFLTLCFKDFLKFRSVTPSLILFTFKGSVQTGLRLRAERNSERLQLPPVLSHFFTLMSNNFLLRNLPKQNKSKRKKTIQKTSGSFRPFHPSLLFCSSSVKLNVTIFRSLQRCSDRFKSGLWSWTFTDLFRSHFCLVFPVCFGSLLSFAQILNDLEQVWAEAPLI